MQRRFNYTDRARLLHADVRFSLKQTDGTLGFDAALDLAEYDLPADSLVFVEAYRQTVWMRFAWGTVGALQPPALRTLTEFDSPEDILFRVRVTSPGTPDEPHGLLLAEADRVRLRGPEDTEEDRDTILPVVPTELGDELWKVSFENQRPRLLVNLHAGGNYKQFTLHPAFIALVYPAAMREVLWHIVFVEGHRDYDDPASDYSRWIRFAVEVLGVGEPPKNPGENEDADDVADWVAGAVAAFSRKHGLLGKFEAFMTGEASS